MDNFIYWNPTKLIFGRGEVEKLAEEVKQYGRNVLLVYGGGALSETVYTIKSFQSLKRRARPSMNCPASNRIRVLPL